MQVKILFLGPAGNLAGCETVSMELTERATVADLRRVLTEKYEGLKPALDSIRFAVNETFCGDDRVLRHGDEVALIPPVSGGAVDDGILIDLVTGAIPAARVRGFVTGDPTLGGIVTFEGVTRADAEPEHGEVVRLEYEAYEAMARKELERIALTARRRWSAGRVAILHRTGSVPPAEVSVMIAVACGRRAEAFEACRWLIDTLKRDVPIWKKDVYENGHTRWVQGERAE